MIVVVCDDLLLGSRFLELLRGAGLDARLGGGVTDATAVVAVVGDEVEAAPEGIASVAVYSHVDVDARDRAKAAGFDLVVPRSRFMREGAELVRGLLDPHV